MPSLRPGLDLKVILWEMSFQFFYFEFISHYEIGYCTLGCHYNTSHPSKFKWIGEKWFLNYWLDNEGSLLLLQGFRLRNFQIDDNFWGSEKFCMWFLEKIESFFFEPVDLLDTMWSKLAFMVISQDFLVKLLV